MRPVNKILKTVAAIVFPILLWSQPVSAQVYQWTDGEGKTHFTDNLNAIPEQFLTEKHKRKMEKLGAPSGGNVTEITEPEEKSGGETQVEKTETKDKEEKVEEPTGPSPEEVAAANQAIDFLRASIQRYERFSTATHNITTSKQLYTTFQGNLAAKKAMADKLAAFELPALKTTGSFLQQSLAQDQAYKRKAAGVIKRNIKATLVRLKNEKPQKEQLIKKLQQVQAVEPATPASTP